MRRFFLVAALTLGLAWSASSAMAQTFAVQSPVVAATTVVTPVYYRPYGAYYRPYGAYYRPYGPGYPYRAYAPYYRPYVAPYRAYYPGPYYYGPRPYVGIGVY
jgi:hypothetical protein